MDDAATDANADVPELIAERDALRAELEGMRAKSKVKGRWRSPVAVALVVLCCLTFTVAVPAVWARRNFLDTDRFVDRVGPVIDDPAVQEALALRVTDELMKVIQPQELFQEALPERGQILAAPLANAVAGFVRDRVELFFGTEAFATLWERSARTAHQTAVRVLEGEGDVLTTGDGQVTFNLIPIVNEVLRDISATSPELVGRQIALPEISADDIPETAIVRLEDALGVELDDDFGQFTVYDEGKLEAAQGAVDLFNRLVFWLVPIAVILAGLAVWVSRKRRRTILELSIGVALGMVLLRRVAFRLDDEIAALPPTEQGRVAAGVVVDAFLDPLLTFTVWTLAIAFIVAAVALVTGPYAWAVSLRRRTVTLWGQVVSGAEGRGRDEAVVSWVRQHRDLLLAGGAFVGVALIWTADLSWFGLLVVLALIAAFTLAVYRIGEPVEQT